MTVQTAEAAAGRRVLIPHIDDVGMCHGANRACIELMGRGFVTTASVMVPCPWFPEIAALARERQDLDLGVHLTLTSEWAGYRWGPVSAAGRASSMVDPDGYFWPRLLQARPHVDPVAAETEFRTQIERALAAGIDATHLDTHMGAAAMPELLPLYLRLGREYRLPILLPSESESYVGALALAEAERDTYREALASLAADEALFVDHFRITPQVDAAEADATYRRMVAELPAGVTFFSLHCNWPGDIEVISPRWAPWRIQECRIAADPAFHAFIADQGIELGDFRTLRDRLRGEKPVSRGHGRPS